MLVLPIIAIILCLLLSALFSGSEIAYASASEIKLRKTNALRAHSIYEKYELALISILVGNNLVNIGSTALATVICIMALGEENAFWAVPVMTVLIIIFGEITPKLVATKNPEGFAKFVAMPLSIWMVITKPVVWLSEKLVKLFSKLWQKNVALDIVTEDDLETIFDTAEEEGVVDEETADLLQGTLDFDDIPVYEIITPRVDMYAINIEDSDDKILSKILKCKYSRVPIYKETPDHIVGILHTTQALRLLASGEKLNLREMMIEPQFVYKTTPLDEVFDVMRKASLHMVIVTDEYGGTMGLVSMEDVLEQLVGEIFDEKDALEEEFVELSEDKFEVDGDMRLEDFFEELDMDEEEDELGDDNATIGGWAIEKIEKYPEVGDSFSYKNLNFTITECEEMRVLGIEVIRKEEA